MFSYECTSRGKRKKEEKSLVDPDCDWAAFYKMAVGSWLMAPSEFWELSPTEFWIIYEAKLPPKTYGKMSESEAERLVKMMENTGGEEWQQ